MPENRLLRVFLCHSSSDKPTVRELYQRLKAEGWIDPWLDEEKLYPGQDWNLEIEKAVEAADTILVCLSNNSITKEGYVHRELRIVLDYAGYKPEGTLYLIPIRLEECDPPRRLRPWQFADYFEKDRDRAYQRLLVSLRMRANSLGISAEKLQAKSDSEIYKLEEKPEHVEPASKYTPVGQAIYILNRIEFVKVDAGKFLMGSSDKDKKAISNEKPQHIVDLPYDYYIARFPATNEQYAAYLDSKGSVSSIKDWEKKRDHPVMSVSWNETMEYCQWLDGLLKGKLPSGWMIRLPTEAEWEKAARWKPSPSGEGKSEGESLIYPWGDAFDKTKCNTNEGGKGGTTPVEAFSPQGDSPYGCADMSGNVWEWTHSLKKPYPYEANDGREDVTSRGRHVLRGGSCDLNERFARCAYRWHSPFYSLLIGRGFRVVAAPSHS